jgi:hypothetical protein
MLRGCEFLALPAFTTGATPTAAAPPASATQVTKLRQRDLYEFVGIVRQGSCDLYGGMH